jgi:sensor histidine kinase regulating citrate/malate metabolism
MVILIFEEKLFYHYIVGRIFVFTLIFYNIVLVIFNFYQNAHIRTVNDLENLRNNINYQSKHLDDIFESQQEIRRIKHDMLREYGGFYGYLENGDYDKLKDCLHSKMEELKTMEKVTFFEEPYIDYAISQKIAYAKNRGIEIKIETKTVSIGNIKPADLSLLIINALDNAIESTEKLEIENKIITFSFHTANNTLLMSFINNVKDKNIDFSKSSKLVDKKNHGFGVSSIKHIVDMYGGYCKYERHDDKISLNVMLPID